MIIALTGTPGTGKTTVASSLATMGYDVIDLTAYIKENGLLGEYDEERDTNEVDIEQLKEHLGHSFSNGNDVVIEGHLSHFMECDMIIVLRCDPSVLKERLEERKYSESKISENVQSEVLDVILCESVDTGKEVYEVDCTSGDTNTIISYIENILSGNTEGHMPGSIGWGEEMEKWF